MRYLPHSEDDIQLMLDAIGKKSIDELFESIPLNQRATGYISKRGKSEPEIRRKLNKLAAKNIVPDVILAGGGAYFHSVSAAVKNIISRSEFQTAYTPYQPEISQGSLQSIFEFQTMVSEIMGLPVANASLYDGGSALGEALLMSVRLMKNKKRKVLVSSAINPLYLQVMHTMLDSFGHIEVEMLPWDKETGKTLLPDEIDSDTAAIALGYPNYFGIIEDLSALSEKAHQAGALAVTSVSDPVVLSVLASPGEKDIDIAVADGMSVAGTQGMGGPGVGLMATKTEFVKQMPGRIVGETVDTEGNTGYVLTLATREQHIRREKATSNICSNQALIALAFTVHTALLGPEGFKRMAVLSRNRTIKLYNKLLETKRFSQVFKSSFFNEFVLKFDGNVDDLISFMASKNVLFGINAARFNANTPEFNNSVLISASELVSEEDLEYVLTCLDEYFAREAE